MALPESLTSGAQPLFGDPRPHQLRRLRQPHPRQLGHDLLRLGQRRRPVLLGVDRLEQRRHLPHFPGRHDVEHVAVKMSDTPLPGRPDLINGRKFSEEAGMTYKLPKKIDDATFEKP